MKRTLYFILLLVGVLFIAACDEVTAALPDNGKLFIQLTDLPSAADAGIEVLGPDNYQEVVDKETTLVELDAGNYRITAKTVTFEGKTYTPDETTIRREVERNQTEEVEITYTQ